MTLIGDVDVGRMGFGCFALSGAYSVADESKGSDVIHAALDLGLRLLDTSDVYAAGHNEELVGRAIKGRRDDAVVTTKFGWVLDDSGRAVALDSSPRHVRDACEASLRRLQIDCIDIYIQHRVDPLTPIEDTVAELVRLRDEGKIRYYGLSEAGPDTIRRADKAAHVAALQTEYSLWSRDPEAELLPLCSELGILFVAYSPLGRGFLSGSIRSSKDLEEGDFRRTHPRFRDENIEKNVQLVDQLNRVALELGCTTAQLALAWLLNRPWPIVPIPATRSEAHLRDNAKALDIRLEVEQLAAVDVAFPPTGVSGARHPAEHMKTIGR